LNLVYLKFFFSLLKISEDKIEGFVLNGAEFIQKIIPEKIYFYCKELEKEEKLTRLVFHVGMNLPGYSAEHLPYFCGFLSKFEEIRFFLIFKIFFKFKNFKGIYSKIILFQFLFIATSL